MFSRSAANSAFGTCSKAVSGGMRAAYELLRSILIAKPECISGPSATTASSKMLWRFKMRLLEKSLRCFQSA